MFKVFYFLILFVVFINLSCSSSTKINEDTENPYIAIIYPPHNSTFIEEEIVQIIVDATDNEAIDEVEFYIDGILSETLNATPFCINWNTSLQVGAHTIYAKAFDSNRNEANSNVLTLIIAEAETGTYSSMTDVEGNIYKIVKIGDHWWMAENLKVTHYYNGDNIPNVPDDTEWGSLSTGACCAYDGDSSNVGTYGLLYNWYAVNDSRSITPDGWHVPTDAEWKELEMYLGMAYSEVIETGFRGTDEGFKLKATNGWNNSGNGINECGFTALPAGNRSNAGSFCVIGSFGNWWSSSEYSSSDSWYRTMAENDLRIARVHYSMKSGMSIRLVRD